MKTVKASDQNIGPDMAYRRFDVSDGGDRLEVDENPGRQPTQVTFLTRIDPDRERVWVLEHAGTWVHVNDHSPSIDNQYRRWSTVQ